MQKSLIFQHLFLKLLHLHLRGKKRDWEEAPSALLSELGFTHLPDEFSLTLVLLKSSETHAHTHANTDDVLTTVCPGSSTPWPRDKPYYDNHITVNSEKRGSFKTRLDPSCPYCYSVSLHPETWKDQKEKTICMKGTEIKQERSLFAGVGVGVTTKSATGPGCAQGQH